MTIAPAGLAPRRCHLRDADHKYVWQPTGEEMAISITGVRDFFKDPDRYSKLALKYPEGSYTRWWVDNCSEIGTHVHRWLYYKATGNIPPDLAEKGINVLGTHTPDGHDCTPWIEQLTAGVVNADRGITMANFWDEIEVLGAEYTMVNTRKSCGGQADLIYRSKQGKTVLLDLKNKSENWKTASKDDLLSYSQQAGGYLELLQSGDDAHSPPWIHQCRTLIITPNQVKWLSIMEPNACSLDWEECWGAYAKVIKSTF